jgi:hypothetical protein
MALTAGMLGISERQVLGAHFQKHTFMKQRDALPEQTHGSLSQDRLGAIRYSQFRWHA